MLPQQYPNFTRLPTANAGDYYHEANLVGTPIYAHGAVKFLLAQFAPHFGADSGTRLRCWASARGWPVLWAWGVGTLPILQMPESWAATHRMLDPASLLASRAGGNISEAARAAAPRWAALWAQARAARARGAPSVTEAQWWVWWGQAQAAAGESLVVEPVRANACAAPDACVGTDKRGQCVCFE